MSRTGRILYRRTSLVNTLKKTCMLLLGLDKQIKEQIERVYGLGKCWVDKQLGFCTEAALDVGLVVFAQSLKLYAPLYLANQGLSRKFDRKAFLDSLRSILRSSAFLGVNAFLVILFFCLSRHLLGRFYYSLCAYVPSFFGSLLAILIERPSRRRALAFYVANLGSETLYQILVSRGYFTPIPNGRYILFTVALTSLLYLFETGTLKDPFVKFVFNLILGAKKRNHGQSTDSKVTEIAQPLTNGHSEPSTWNQLVSWYRQLKARSSHLLPFARHPLCPHSNSGCLEELLLNGALKPFLIGYASQLALGTFPKLLSFKRNTLSEYLLNPRYLFSSRHTSFGLFLAAFTTVYQSTRCALRWTTGKNSHSHALLASLVASPTHLIAPSTSVTLYLVWKCIEAFFSIAARKGLIPYDQFAVHIIYAMACAELFYAAVLDPLHLKPSYKKFLNRVTGNKLAYINRNVLEVFGTKASSGFESLLPLYDLAYTTRRFQESVLVWLL